MVAVPKSHHSGPVAHVLQLGHTMVLASNPTGTASGMRGPASPLSPSGTDPVTHGRGTLGYRGKATPLNLAFGTSTVCCQPYFQGCFALLATPLIPCSQTKPL